MPAGYIPILCIVVIQITGLLCQQPQQNPYDASNIKDTDILPHVVRSAISKEFNIPINQLSEFLASLYHKLGEQTDNVQVRNIKSIEELPDLVNHRSQLLQTELKEDGDGGGGGGVYEKLPMTIRKPPPPLDQFLNGGAGGEAFELKRYSHSEYLAEPEPETEQNSVVVTQPSTADNRDIQSFTNEYYDYTDSNEDFNARNRAYRSNQIDGNNGVNGPNETFGSNRDNYDGNHFNFRKGGASYFDEQRFYEDVKNPSNAQNNHLISFEEQNKKNAKLNSNNNNNNNKNLWKIKRRQFESSLRPTSNSNAAATPASEDVIRNLFRRHNVGKYDRDQSYPEKGNTPSREKTLKSRDYNLYDNPYTPSHVTDPSYHLPTTEQPTYPATFLRRQNLQKNNFLRNLENNINNNNKINRKNQRGLPSTDNNYENNRFWSYQINGLQPGASKIPTVPEQGDAFFQKNGRRRHQIYKRSLTNENNNASSADTGVRYVFNERDKTEKGTGYFSKRNLYEKRVKPMGPLNIVRSSVKSVTIAQSPLGYVMSSKMDNSTVRKNMSLKEAIYNKVKSSYVKQKRQLGPRFYDRISASPHLNVSSSTVNQRSQVNGTSSTKDDGAGRGFEDWSYNGEEYLNNVYDNFSTSRFVGSSLASDGTKNHGQKISQKLPQPILQNNVSQHIVYTNNTVVCHGNGQDTENVENDLASTLTAKNSKNSKMSMDKNVKYQKFNILPRPRNITFDKLEYYVRARNQQQQQQQKINSKRLKRQKTHSNSRFINREATSRAANNQLDDFLLDREGNIIDPTEYIRKEAIRSGRLSSEQLKKILNQTYISNRNLNLNQKSNNHELGYGYPEYNYQYSTTAYGIKEHGGGGRGGGGGNIQYLPDDDDLAAAVATNRYNLLYHNNRHYISNATNDDSSNASSKSFKGAKERRKVKGFKDLPPTLSESPEEYYYLNNLIKQQRMYDEGINNLEENVDNTNVRDFSVPIHVEPLYDRSQRYVKGNEYEQLENLNIDSDIQDPTKEFLQGYRIVKSPEIPILQRGQNLESNGEVNKQNSAYESNAHNNANNPPPIPPEGVKPRSADVIGKSNENYQKGGIVTKWSKVTDIQVKCDFKRNQMDVKIKFNAPFHGVIYAKGFYKTQACRTDGHGESEILYQLPFNGCGMQTFTEGQNLLTGKMKLQNVIIVMFDSLSGILEAQDTAFRTSCIMGGNGNTILKANIQVPMIDASKEILPDKSGIPPAWMKIVKGKDPFDQAANLLHLGQIGTIAINAISFNGLIDIFAFNCYAHDGMGMGIIHLIDDKGCPIHGKLIGPQAKTEFEDKIVVFAHFKVFKFPDIQNVFFECSVKFCHEHCQPINCPGYSISKHYEGTKRFKRDINNESLPQNQSLAGTRAEENYHLFQSIAIALPEYYHYSDIIESPGNIGEPMVDTVAIYPNKTKSAHITPYNNNINILQRLGNYTLTNPLETSAHQVIDVGNSSYKNLYVEEIELDDTTDNDDGVPKDQKSAIELNEFISKSGKIVPLSPLKDIQRYVRRVGEDKKLLNHVMVDKKIISKAASNLDMKNSSPFPHPPIGMGETESLTFCISNEKLHSFYWLTGSVAAIAAFLLLLAFAFLVTKRCRFLRSNRQSVKAAHKAMGRVEPDYNYCHNNASYPQHRSTTESRIARSCHNSKLIMDDKFDTQSVASVRSNTSEIMNLLKNLTWKILTNRRNKIPETFEGNVQGESTERNDSYVSHHSTKDLVTSDINKELRKCSNC